MSDLNEMKLLEESYEYDPEAQLNPSVMVPDGWHDATVKLGKGGIKVAQSKGKTYLKAHFAASINAPGERYDRRVVGDFPTSIVFESSNTSMLHVAATAAGVEVPQRGTLGTLKAALEAAYGGEGTQIQVKTRWEGQIDRGENYVNPSTGETGKRYERILSGMSKFPQAADGSHVPTVEYLDQETGRQFTIEGRESIKDFRKAGSGATASAV